jgi:LEA14-like dessication related protein
MDEIVVEGGQGSAAILKARAEFYNPNNVRMKLKEINVRVLVDGKQRASSDQKLDVVIPPTSAFSLPLEVNITLKDLGLFDTVMALLGGKKYEIIYIGYVRVKVHGITVKVPIQFRDQIRLKI